MYTYTMPTSPYDALSLLRYVGALSKAADGESEACAVRRAPSLPPVHSRWSDTIYPYSSQVRFSETGTYGDAESPQTRDDDNPRKATISFSFWAWQGVACPPSPIFV